MAPLTGLPAVSTTVPLGSTRRSKITAMIMTATMAAIRATEATDKNAVASAPRPLPRPPPPPTVQHLRAMRF